MTPHGWIGVDFDGTLAAHDNTPWPGAGAPIMPMIDRVRAWLAAGIDVRIVTARADHEEHRWPVVEFCRAHFGVPLPITDRKDFQMVELWDDRARHVLSDGTAVHERYERLLDRLAVAAGLAPAPVLCGECGRHHQADRPCPPQIGHANAS